MVASNAATSGGGDSDGNLAATYTLIHSFLKSRSHDKAAAALRKAAIGTVILRDDVQPEETPLDEIIKWWKQKNVAAAVNAPSTDSGASSSESDSSSSSTSSSSSDEDSSDSDSSSSSSGESKKDTKVNVQIQQRTVSSDSDSTDGASDSDSASSSSSSRSDSDLANSSSTSSTKSKPSNGVIQPKKTPVNGEPTRPTIKKEPKSEANSPEKNDMSPSVKIEKTEPALDGSTPRVTKKRRISENGSAVPTAEDTEVKNAVSVAKSNGKAREKGPRKNNVPFRRIKEETVEFHDDRLKDNTYVARGASTGDYGAQANRDLIVTRGDGFRKEKNKKKRGSYRGGEITLQSHSVKF